MRSFDRAGVFMGRLARARLGLLRTPYRVNFCVTYRCQSRCTMCGIWKMKPRGEMTLEEIERFAALNRGFSWVQLTGGEPTLRDDLPRIARIFAQTSRPYVLTSQSNGLTSPERVAAFVQDISRLKVPRFVYTLSLDGPRKIHDAQRGIPGNFDRTLEAYGLIKDLPGVRTVFGFTMTALNVGELPATVSAVRERYPEVTEDDFHMNVAQTSGHYYGNAGVSPAPDPLAATFAIGESLMRRKRTDLTAQAERRFLRGLCGYLAGERVPTGEMRSSVYLDSWGGVWPSIMWDRRLGSIRETGYRLRPIWEGLEATACREQVRRGANPRSWTSCEAYQPLLERWFA